MVNKLNNLKDLEGLSKVAEILRKVLNEKNYVLLFGYNGTGKTRLSMEFKEQGKKESKGDTLYFNAYTEDLFYWDNDIKIDYLASHPIFYLNKDSKFFDILNTQVVGFSIEDRIKEFLSPLADFEFYMIDYEGLLEDKKWGIVFYRELDGKDTPIKISRGEENIFVWCFFLAIVQLALDNQESYNWVKYIYIDDPISSLDDNNAIAVACHLTELLKTAKGRIKTVISSHHALFFNVVWHSFSKKDLQPFFLKVDKAKGVYCLDYTDHTPFFHHVALLKQLHETVENNEPLYTYHFNILRSILEKTAAFHGFPNFSECLKQDVEDNDDILHTRAINVLSHGNYSLFEPRELAEDNKQLFKKILNEFLEKYSFNLR